MQVTLKPTRPLSLIPSIKYISSFLKKMQLINSQRIIIPYLHENIEFIVNVADPVICDAKTEFSINVFWQNVRGLLISSEVEKITLDIEFKTLTKQMVVGQDDLIFELFEDLSSFLSCDREKKIFPSRVVNLVGLSGSGKTYLLQSLKQTISQFPVLQIDCRCLEDALRMLNEITASGKPGLFLVENLNLISVDSIDFDSFDSQLAAKFLFYLRTALRSYPLYCIFTSEKKLDRDGLVFIDKYLWINWYSVEQADALLQFYGYSGCFRDELCKRLEGFMPCEVKLILCHLLSHQITKDNSKLELVDFEIIQKIILQNYPSRLNKSKFNPNCTEIIGMHDILYNVSNLFSAFLQHSLTYTKGILLYGKSGTGKSLLIASLSQKFSSLGLNFLFIDPSQIRSKFLGNTEKSLKEQFSQARSFPKCVIVIDQIDALFSIRTGSISNRLVNCFLSEMDDNENCFFVGITQDINSVDEAIRRPGRLFPHFKCKNLNIDERRDFLKRFSFSPNELRMLLEHTSGFTGAEMNGFIRKVSLNALNKKGMNAASLLYDDFSVFLSK